VKPTIKSAQIKEIFLMHLLFRMF